ncbi:MAG: hypothetical protein ACP5QW_01090 [bacterium]
MLSKTTQTNSFLLSELEKILLLSSIILAMFLTNYGCGGSGNSSSSLTPARNIVGTWKTTFPTTFYIKTDFCTLDGTLELVASEDRMVTFIISAVSGTDTQVNIEQDFTSSNFTIIKSCFGTGYVPDVSPNFYTGVITGTTLVVYDSSHIQKGIFTFTTDLMQGTWDDSWCMAGCQEVYTNTNQLKLTRQ